MISPFVAVWKAGTQPERLFVNPAHLLSVEQGGAVDGRECIVLLFTTGPLLIYGTLDEWERATGTAASVGRERG